MSYLFKRLVAQMISVYELVFVRVFAFLQFLFMC